ncbi:MAG: hypothetical protein P4L91_09770 [Burkholderiaceae bacterium]|nr:hypothetical protein [Burkholderiaceae bacterium]
MIYVVEFPQQGRASAWFTFGQQDFVRKIYAGDKLRDYEIYDVASARELLDSVDATPETADVRDKFPAMCALADRYGWDTVLYRADYLFGAGVFQPIAVSEAAACAGALAKRLKACRVYWNDAEATDAIDNDPIFDGVDGYWAREALREQLVALEIVEGL